MFVFIGNTCDLIRKMYKPVGFITILALYAAFFCGKRCPPEHSVAFLEVNKHACISLTA